ncbi:MAG: MATE family efflux transporter [Ruminococcaceae bacterium]|nr:MATE family efflux transporter [Oscillospiraceae bacterium]
MQSSENKMGTMPVFRLLVTMALPMIASMMVQALYNIVDSIYVSRISENALTAVSLAFPIQNLMIAVGTGTGVGVGALLSRALGEKNQKDANRLAEHGCFLAVLSYLAFLLIGLFGSRAFFAVQTDVPEIVEGGVQYMFTVTVFSFGLFTQLIFEKLMQATGRTVLSMLTQGIGAVLNIILDPIFIFTLDMGILGAAVATVVGQIIAAVFGIWLNARYNREIKLDPMHFRPSWSVIRRIYAIGVPSIIMASIGSVMTFCLNKILIAFTETAAAVFGVYFKLQSFVFMPLFGVSNGMISILSYNYGARRQDRMMAVIRYTAGIALGFMLFGVLLMQLIPGPLLLLFNADENMLGIGIPALRIISLSFPLAAFGITASSTFQALGRGFLSMTISIARQLVALVPLAWLLARTGMLSSVWLAFPLAELVSTTLAAIFLVHIYRRVIKPLGEPAPESV